MNKRKCFWLIGLLLAACLILCGFDSRRQKVYDRAGLFAGWEAEKLQQTCVEIGQREKLDVIILTQNTRDKREAEEIADDFYDEMGFGYEGPHGTGIILVIDMYNRIYSVTTSGYAIEWFTDREIEAIYDEMEWPMRQGEYGEACTAFLEQVVRLKNNSEQAQNGYYDEETGQFISTEPTVWERAFSLWKVLLRLVIAAGIGCLGVFIMKRQTKPRMSVGQSTYLKEPPLRLTHKADRYLRETVVSRIIPKANVSSGGGRGGGGFSSSHRSGGGFSHGGGGGRRF